MVPRGRLLTVDWLSVGENCCPTIVAVPIPVRATATRRRSEALSLNKLLRPPLQTGTRIRRNRPCIYARCVRDDGDRDDPRHRSCSRPTGSLPGQTSSIRAINSAAVNGFAMHAAAPCRRAIGAISNCSNPVTTITGGEVSRAVMASRIAMPWMPGSTSTMTRSISGRLFFSSANADCASVACSRAKPARETACVMVPFESLVFFDINSALGFIPPVERQVGVAAPRRLSFAGQKLRCLQNDRRSKAGITAAG